MTRLPRPYPKLAVAHSPTPSRVRMAASSKGEGKKALAAWDSWCSVKTMRRRYRPCSPLLISRGRWSFWRSHRGIAFRNEANPAGANAR